MSNEIHEQTAAKMRQLLQGASEAHNASVSTPVPRMTQAPAAYAGWTPPCNAGEFLVLVKFAGQLVLCALQEPTWRQAAAIEMYAFRRSDNGQEYFSGEQERRELLRISLRWVADPETNSVRHSPSLSELAQGFVEALWRQVAREFFVQLEEASSLYASAVSFFKGELGHPVHPVILDVNGIMKGMFTFNGAEWNAVSMSDFERYQIVWSAYQEHLTTGSAPEPTVMPPSPPLRAWFGPTVR
ncbi:MAG: hypothetical protein JSS66_05030 [Armatimonadetes bacterium]|nr:hypothetical protein [Armatimonadota bacterium]